MFEINTNKDNRQMSITSGVAITNFEHYSHFDLVLLLLTLIR